MSLFKKKQSPSIPGGDSSLSATDINEILYKRNAELAIKNKALSLLSHLYEISILALKPNDIAHSVSDSVRTALNYEFVSIFLYDETKDTLSKIGFATSDRFTDELKLSGHSFENINIAEVSKKEFFQQVIVSRLPELHKNFGYILHHVLDAKEVDRLADRAHLKSSLVYPLKLGDRVLGIFVVGMNREYDTLPDYEKDIIANIVNVVSLAVDKSLIYEELHVANEKLKDLDKLKTEFLSLASHQLRSPLTAIKGYTSMLLDGSFGAIAPSQKEAIDRVFQSSVHLAKVVEDLLNVSKIEQGGMKYEMNPFDFEKVAKDLATDLSITAEKKGLKLTFETDNRTPYTVNGDMEKIRQVVLNIIDNSIKYTEQGSITVSLKKPSQTSIRLDVIDTGMGISAEEKEKLFQKFGRGAGGKTNTGGSGLGLYLAKQIAEAHGGHIAIDSPGVGKGSTFSIELKAA